MATVRVELAPGIAEVGLRLQVAGLLAPLGAVTAQVRSTLLANPFDAVMEMVVVFPVVAPAAKLSDPGLLLMVKLGGGGTAEIVTVTVAVELMLPDVPVAVTV